MNRLRLPLILLAIAGTACSHVSSSAFRIGDRSYPPHPGTVRISLSREPDAGTSVAIIQVYSSRVGSIEDLVPEMCRVAASLGADYVKIDRVKTLFEQRDETKTSSYECGTDKEKKTCTDTTTETVHEATTQLLGRAFRGVP
jgi:hypothetical protein